MATTCPQAMLHQTTVPSIEAVAPRHHRSSASKRGKGSAVGMTSGNHLHHIMEPQPMSRWGKTIDLAE